MVPYSSKPYILTIEPFTTGNVTPSCGHITRYMASASREKLEPFPEGSKVKNPEMNCSEDPVKCREFVLNVSEIGKIRLYVWAEAYGQKRSHEDEVIVHVENIK